MASRSSSCGCRRTTPARSGSGPSTGSARARAWSRPSRWTSPPRWAPRKRPPRRPSSPPRPRPSPRPSSPEEDAMARRRAQPPGRLPGPTDDATSPPRLTQRAWLKALGIATGAALAGRLATPATPALAMTALPPNVGIVAANPPVLLQVGPDFWIGTLAPNIQIASTGTYTSGTTDAEYGRLHVGVDGNASFGAGLVARRDSNAYVYARL